MGEGFAAAAVSQGRVYVLDHVRDAAPRGIDRSADVLRCLSLDDGRELWHNGYPVVVPPHHGMSRTIPAVAGGCVVSLGPQCQVACWDAAGGKAHWLIDLVLDYGATVPPWYAGQCPLIDAANDRLILAPGGRALLDRGRLPHGQGALGEPQSARLDDDAHLDHAHGSRRPADVRLLRQGRSGGRVGRRRRDPLGDDRLADRRGHLPLAGGRRRRARLLLRRLQRRQPDAASRPPRRHAWAAETLFRLTPQQFGSEQQTPILCDGCLYGVRQRDRRLVCLDLAGRELWNSGRDKFGLGPYLIADGLIFAMNDDGLLQLARATADGYEPLDRAQVIADGASSWGPMALAAGPLDRPRFDAHDVPRRGRGAGPMKQSAGDFMVGGLGCRWWPRRQSPSARSPCCGWIFAASGRVAAPPSAPAVDPALIAYRQTAEWPVACARPARWPSARTHRIYIGGDRECCGCSGPTGPPRWKLHWTDRRSAWRWPVPRPLSPAASTSAWKITSRCSTPAASGLQAGSRRPPAASLSGIAAAEQDVFVADAGNRIVWRYDLSGKLKGRIGRARTRPKTIPASSSPATIFPLALGADGLLHVVNPRGLRVEAFTFDGDLELAWGKGSPGVDGFSAAATRPTWPRWPTGVSSPWKRAPGG